MKLLNVRYLIGLFLGVTSLTACSGSNSNNAAAPCGQYGSAYGASPYGISPYGASPYSVRPYGASPYGASPYGVSPYGASPYGTAYNSPYGASPCVAGASPYGYPGALPQQQMMQQQMMQQPQMMAQQQMMQQQQMMAQQQQANSQPFFHLDPSQFRASQGSSTSSPFVPDKISSSGQSSSDITITAADLAANSSSLNSGNSGNSGSSGNNGNSGNGNSVSQTPPPPPNNNYIGQTGSSGSSGSSNIQPIEVPRISHRAQDTGSGSNSSSAQVQSGSNSGANSSAGGDSGSWIGKSTPRATSSSRLRINDVISLHRPYLADGEVRNINDILSKNTDAKSSAENNKATIVADADYNSTYVSSARAQYIPRSLADALVYTNASTDQNFRVCDADTYGPSFPCLVFEQDFDQNNNPIKSVYLLAGMRNPQTGKYRYTRRNLAVNQVPAYLFKSRMSDAQGNAVKGLVIYTVANEAAVPSADIINNYLDTRNSQATTSGTSSGGAPYIGSPLPSSSSYFCPETGNAVQDNQCAEANVQRILAKSGSKAQQAYNQALANGSINAASAQGKQFIICALVAEMTVSRSFLLIDKSSWHTYVDQDGIIQQTPQKTTVMGAAVDGTPVPKAQLYCQQRNGTGWDKPLIIVNDYPKLQFGLTFRTPLNYNWLFATGFGWAPNGALDVLSAKTFNYDFQTSAGAGVGLNVTPLAVGKYAPDQAVMFAGQVSGITGLEITTEISLGGHYEILPGGGT